MYCYWGVRVYGARGRWFEFRCRRMCRAVMELFVIFFNFFAHRCHYHYRFLLLSLGCSGVTPSRVGFQLFYLSDLVSPLFFVNLPTNVFLRVSPPWRVSPGGFPPHTLVTPLSQAGAAVAENWNH